VNAACATWLTLPCQTCGHNLRCCAACRTCAEHHEDRADVLRLDGTVTKVEESVDDDGAPVTTVTVKGMGGLA
jgi:hypothetical protein